MAYFQKKIIIDFFIEFLENSKRQTITRLPLYLSL